VQDLVSSEQVGSRAVFLDRDGTLVLPRHYPRHPEELVLYPGLAPELVALRTLGFQLVVITNQSGIARGLVTPEELTAMHAFLSRQLANEGAVLDGFYFCPHHPDGVVPSLSVDCLCRKPHPGLILRAAGELDIDLAGSWMVGDILDDVEAGASAGCRTILVDLGTEDAPKSALRSPDYVARTTHHALRIIRHLEGDGDPVEIGYAPSAWLSVKETAGAR
jgi:D-glycero-D-manno-heptose 1,7-bisphosphate phosphatase